MEYVIRLVAVMVLAILFVSSIFWLPIRNESSHTPLSDKECTQYPNRTKREAEAEKSTVQFENSTHKIISHDSEGIVETISGDSKVMGEGHKVTTASDIFDDSQDEDRAKQNFDANTIHGPVTAESMKASSQLIVNPNFAPSNAQMPPCFYQQTPASTSAHNGGFVPSPYGMPMYPPPFYGYPYQHQNGRVVNSFPPGYFGYPPMHPMFPPPQTVPCNQMAGITQAGYPYYPFAQEFRTASTPLSAEENNDHHDDMRASDHYRDAQSMSSKIYGNHTSRPSARQMTCVPGLTSCSSGLCISEAKWCDGFVDCPDSSDEISCPCKSRINQDKLCDGYFDCPLGEDEMGCMGCHPTEFSCDDWTERKSTVTCFKLEQRCDGVPLCPNRKDELDCTMLSDSVRHHAIFAVSQTEGFLHKNYRGKWYPVCENPYLWAAEACERESGPLTRSPFIQIMDTPMRFHGRYIEHIFGSRVTFVPGCFNGKGMYVTCPKLTCGTRINDKKGPLDENFDRSQRNRRHLHEEFIDPESRDLILDIVELEPQIEIPPFEEFRPIDLAVDHEGNVLQLYQEDHNIMDVLNSGHPLLFPLDYDYYDENGEQDYNFTDISRGKRGERIVGGRASEPQSWPWAVAIFKDGRFHCDGTIISEMWVLSAAHCVTDYWKHYYEIQLGMLRQFSFSPQEQSHRISHIIVNSGYHRSDMHNDLSLMMLATPARFNRWVRPACLPSAATAGLDWRWGPRPGTLCTAIGWGALFEHGPDPDHLREVDVPILKNCNHKNDREGHEICAGLPQGGKDACQGDSGGPLLCRNPHDSEQWYILGIVSHGEGCARPGEPGVYTRVSIFVEWIHEHMRTENLPTRTPKRTCPGFTCTWGFKRCLPMSRHCDKTVDCLGGEDEANCVYLEGRENEQQEKPIISKTNNITLSSNRDNSTENSDKMEATAKTIKILNFTTKTNDNLIKNIEDGKTESITPKPKDDIQVTEALIPNVSKILDESTRLSNRIHKPNENVLKNREDDITESITPEAEDDIQVAESLNPNVSKIIDETTHLSDLTPEGDENLIKTGEDDTTESITAEPEDDILNTEALNPNESKITDETTHLPDVLPEPNENIIKNREDVKTESMTPKLKDKIQVNETLIPNVSKIIEESIHLSNITPEPNENLMKNREDDTTESLTPEPEDGFQVTEALNPNVFKIIDETTHLSDFTPERNKNLIISGEDDRTQSITPENEDNILVTESLISDMSKIKDETTHIPDLLTEINKNVKNKENGDTESITTESEDITQITEAPISDIFPDLLDGITETNENPIKNREDDTTESITPELGHNIDAENSLFLNESDGIIAELKSADLTIDDNLKSLVTEIVAALVEQTTEIQPGENMESPTPTPKDNSDESVIIQDGDDIRPVLSEENTAIPVTTISELDDVVIDPTTLSMLFKTDENSSNTEEMALKENEEYQNSNEDFKSADFTDDDYLESAKSQGDINDSRSIKFDENISEMQENVSNESVAIDFHISENDKSNDLDSDEYDNESPKSDEKNKEKSSGFLLSTEIGAHDNNHTETVTQAVTSELGLNNELNENPTLAIVSDENQTDVLNTTTEAIIDKEILPEVTHAKNTTMDNHDIETHDTETVSTTVNAELSDNTTLANDSDIHIKNHTDVVITTTAAIIDSNILPEVIGAKNNTMENNDIESHDTETTTMNTESSENTTLPSASHIHEENHTNVGITTTEAIIDNNILPEVDPTKNTSIIVSDNDVTVETHSDILMNDTIQTLSLATTTFSPINLTTDKIHETTTLETLDISDNVIDIGKNITIADVLPSKIHKKEMTGLNDIVISKRPGFGKSLKDQKVNSTDIEPKILVDQEPLTIDIISALSQVEHKGLENVSKTIPALEKPKLPLPNVFVCRRMEQFIPMSKRCDRVPNCEDGTDEFDCSCADYLRASNKYSNLICDGYLDCLDGTDEEECHFCPEDHFHCHISRTCIPSAAVCNHFSDCSFGEDELDCFALTDGHKVLFDKDLRPHLNVEGIVTSRHKGVWEPVCNIITEPKEREEIALHMCKYLGFKDYYNFNFIELQRQRKMEFVNMTSFARKNHSPQIVQVDTPVLDFPDLSEVEGQLSKGEHPGLEGLSHPFQVQMSIPDHVASCNTLFVRCITNMASNITKHVLPEIADVGALVPDESFAIEAEELYMWPWMAKVYVDGIFCCTGVLMDLCWVLAEASCLVQLSISTNYVAVVIGSKQTIPSIVGPYEQTIPVDYIKTLDFSNASMIHLQSPAIYSRYVRPMGMPDFNINSVKESEICIAVGIDSLGETESVFLQPLQQHCGVMNKCFKRFRDVDCNTDKMKVLASPWKGIISCHSDEGWFPSAIYNDPLGFCGFSDVVALPNIAHLRTDIKVTMTRYMEIPTWQPPTCDGVRCYRGKCIPMSQVCDGTVDCEFNTDESFSNCPAKKTLCSNKPDDILCACPPGMMHCSSGECIHKSLFSNGVKDCKDGSDEPELITCVSYLNVVSPQLVCDGFQHCLDRTDEDTKLCGCFAKNAYRCEDQSCVAQDFVCDGKPDCPGGEDERVCIGIRSLGNEKYGSGEVIEMTRGLWHTKCFPKPITKKTELEDVCRQLNFHSGHAALLEPSSELIFDPPVQPFIHSYSTVNVNDNVTIILRNQPNSIVDPRLLFNGEECFPVYLECA